MNRTPKFKPGDFVLHYDPYTRKLKRLLILHYREGYGRYKAYDMDGEGIIEPLEENCFINEKEYYEAQLKEERKKLSWAMQEFNKNTKYYKEKLKACGG